MSRTPALLAVDGGNSKTDVALLDGHGELLGAARGAGCSFEPDDHGRSMETLARTIDAASRAAGLAGRPPAGLGVFCVAGADLPADVRRLAGAMRATGWSREQVVRNDTFAVLRAGSERGWGVAVVCGSGLNCAGVGPDGVEARFPAVGEFSGDFRGGGGWLGRRALGAATRGSDGRGPRTALAETIPAHFELAEPLAVVEAIHVGRLPGSALTRLSPLVFSTAARGDEVARALVDELADEVVAVVRASLRRLGLVDSDADVVLGGGVFRTEDVEFHERIAAGIAEAAPAARLLRLAVPPVVGAALLGLDRLAVTDGAHARVRTALTHELLAGAAPLGGRAEAPWPA